MRPAIPLAAGAQVEGGFGLLLSWRACIAAVALVIAAAPVIAAEPELRPWSRGATPALAAPDLSGNLVDLRALRGRVVLVQFWATWCEPCVEDLPALVRLRSALRGRPFEVLTVNYGEAPARVERFLREHGVELPVVLDRERRLGEAWGVGGLPMAFLVDAKGRVRSWVFGACDWMAGEPAVAVERLVAEAAEAPEGGQTPAGRGRNGEAPDR